MASTTSTEYSASWIPTTWSRPTPPLSLPSLLLLPLPLEAHGNMVPTYGLSQGTVAPGVLGVLRPTFPAKKSGQLKIWALLLVTDLFAVADSLLSPTLSALRSSTATHMACRRPWAPPVLTCVTQKPLKPSSPETLATPRESDGHERQRDTKRSDSSPTTQAERWVLMHTASFIDNTRRLWLWLRDFSSIAVKFSGHFSRLAVSPHGSKTVELSYS
ncbi:hypothetical protein F5Y19DRAFT_480490 [Xylariaceae sp. FL1651]|nr:hypothetical protein F5Y19DRAFT_480490 [Xylariaceae sp. FL1651]